VLNAVRKQRLEGIVGKRKDSLYEPGKRSGAWIKDRVNLGQEFVVGGFTPGPHGLDAIIVGYYRGKDLIYVARTRNGFVPASRRRAFNAVPLLVIPNKQVLLRTCSSSPTRSAVEASFEEISLPLNLEVGSKFTGLTIRLDED
jgi:ATP-dependent DNA ligase